MFVYNDTAVPSVVCLLRDAGLCDSSCLSCRQCCVGTELVDWLVLQSACVLTRSHAVGMWQALLEERVLNHGKFSGDLYIEMNRYYSTVQLEPKPVNKAVNIVFVSSLVDQDLGFQDKYLFYRFLDDEEEDTPLPSEEEKRESEEELPETILFLAQIGPDALLRMILKKSSVTVSNNII